MKFETKLEFLQELTEARLFRWQSTLDGRRISELAKLAYVMFLSLEVLRHYDSNKAKEYAAKTMQYNRFHNMSSSSTDLYNILAVLSEPEKYPNVNNDAAISVPFFNTRRYFMELASRQYHVDRNRAFFLSMEQKFKITDGLIKHYRREIVDWYTLDSTSRDVMIRDFYHTLHNTANLSDLYLLFRDSVYNRRK